MAPTQVDISISTFSQEIDNWQNLPPAQPPTITLNGNPLPAPSNAPPWQPVGAQVVVFDSSQDLTNPASIISNKYLIVADMQGSWSESYRWMYDGIATQIMSSGDTQQQVVILATFGLDVAMVPTAATFGLCLERGAGKMLQAWGLMPIPSEGGGYIYYPTNYLLIGNTAYDYGEGYEQFASQPGATLTTTLEATIDNPGAAGPTT